MKKIIMLFILISMMISACDKDRERESELIPRGYKSAANEKYTFIAFNGTIEGCNLYHVSPKHGYYDYDLAICPHGKTYTSSGRSESSGKSSHTRIIKAQTIQSDSDKTND